MKISAKNLGLIVPQRSAISASKDDLKGKFQVLEVVARRDASYEVTTDSLTTDRTEAELGQLQIRLRSDKGRMYTMSLRQFIGLPLAPPAMTVEDITKEMTDDAGVVQNQPVGELLEPLYKSILDTTADPNTPDDVDLPDNIVFAYVADRTTTADINKKVYPANLYKAFQKRVDEDTLALKKQYKKDKTPVNDQKRFDVGTVYQDYSFMRELENGEIRDGLTNPEAQKILVLSKVQ